MSSPSDPICLEWDDLPQPTTLTPREMLETKDEINILAPLVRCSKLPFRHLMSYYETHITHTPMILAAEFSRSQPARLSDFSTSGMERGVYWMEDLQAARRRRLAESPDISSLLPSNTTTPIPLTKHTPTPPAPLPTKQHPHRRPPTSKPPSKHHTLTRGLLIAQFAASESKSLADAVELISKPSPISYTADGKEVGRGMLVDGIDLNCGCPQPWAYSEGIGSALLRKPELVADLVRGVKDRMGWDYPISIKIRVDGDLTRTNTLIRTALQTNISHLTIHGRTRHQPSSHPVSLEAIKFAVDAVRGEVACVGNGDVWAGGDGERMRRECGVRGVMTGRGGLANPALFAGYSSTPQHAVERFLDLSVSYGFIYPLFQRHLSYMLESTFSRADRLYFNSLGSYAGVGEWLGGRGVDCGALGRGVDVTAGRGRGVVGM